MAHFFQNYNSGTELYFCNSPSDIRLNLDFCLISYRRIIPVLWLRTSWKFGAVRNDLSTRVQSHPSDRARLFGSRRQWPVCAKWGMCCKYYFPRLYYGKFWFHYLLNRTWLGWSRDWVTWKPLFGWTVLRSVTEILYGHLAWLNWFTFRLSICYRHLSPTRNPFRWSRMRITSFWESLDCELLVTSRIRQSHLNFPSYLLLLLHTRIKFYQI